MQYSVSLSTVFNAITLVGRHLESPVCLKCGSFQIQNSGFCVRCENAFVLPKMNVCKIENLTAMQTPDIFPLDVFSIIRWKKNESDSLSEWVHLLKSPASASRWDWIVDRLEFKKTNSATDIILDANTLLLPIPGHRKSYHTKNFCLALSRSFGCRILENTFSFLPKTRQQKLLSSFERSKVELVLNEEFTELLQQSERLVLVDDVVTTGATLNSATRALYSTFSAGNANLRTKINALTLFYRV